MLDKPLDQISLIDLQSLVVNRVSESRSIEFKRELPAQDGDLIREFIADVSSFANASGGDIIYGIDEIDGCAAEVCGVISRDPDADVLRLEQSIRSNVEPKLIGVKFHVLRVDAGIIALIIRIPAGLMPPHRVTYRNSGKFFSRNSRGKFEMDVHELRHAFTQSAQGPNFFRSLHQQAIRRAMGEDMPFGVDFEPTAVISTIPLSLFRESPDLPINSDIAVVPFRTTAYSSMDMIEGVLIHTPVKTDTQTVRSYALTHRVGMTDFVFTFGRREGSGNDRRWHAWPKVFEAGLATAVRATIARLGPFDVIGPWAVLASVFNVEGHVVPLGHWDQSAPAYRKQALLGEIRFDEYRDDVLLPIAKNIWLLFGVARPPNWEFPAEN